MTSPKRGKVTADNIATDKKQGIKDLIRMLHEDTRNIDLWLELASLYDETEKKREILRGVLLIEPRNTVVQAALDELDEAAETYTEVSPETGQHAESKVFSIPIEIPHKESAQQESAEKPATNQRPHRSRDRRARRLSKTRRRCPYCGGVVHVSATRCRHCRVMIESVVDDETSDFFLGDPQEGSVQQKSVKTSLSGRRLPRERKIRASRQIKTRKICPNCGGMVHISATRCRHCREKIRGLGDIEESPKNSAPGLDENKEEESPERLRTGCLLALVIVAIIVLLVAIMVVLPMLPY
jgi:hypothetical protein